MMAKTTKKKPKSPVVNDTPAPQDVILEETPVIDEGEVVEDAPEVPNEPVKEGRAALRLRLEEREQPQPKYRLLDDGRYCETAHERERTVMIDGQRYEHVADDARGYWIYARS